MFLKVNPIRCVPPKFIFLEKSFRPVRPKVSRKVLSAGCLPKKTLVSNLHPSGDRLKGFFEQDKETFGGK
jgi:hypothetical protein